jgi:TonB family protein
MPLILEVTPEGRAKDIKAPKPLPYGLTESAIEAVKKWKFRPATGPDGKPAAVRQVIEISFDCSRNAASEPVD